ncbi:hypothetical protein [Helicobacter bilis]|nr:hypothetical protein [Helicobacter bilis]
MTRGRIDTRFWVFRIHNSSICGIALCVFWGFRGRSYLTGNDCL